MVDHELEIRILKNQIVALKGIGALLTPHCRGIWDKNGETETNVQMIDALQETEAMLSRRKEADNG